MSGDATLARALDLTAKLVSFDTESSRSNLALIDFVEDYLRPFGLPVARVPNAGGDKAALCVTVGPMRDGGIVLSGHTDVVPVAGQSWTSDPFTLRRDGTRLYGRGTCDMKGFGATALAMVPEFMQAGMTAPVHIVLSYDEETTCLGSRDVIARFGKDLPMPRATIVGEPTNMQVADAHKSIATYFTKVTGFEAHSAKPALGAHAIATGCELVHHLTLLNDAYERDGDPSGRFDPAYSTVHVGTIHGGTARNILAKECAFHWEFRGLPGVSQQDAIRRFEEYAARTALPRLTRFTQQAGIETQVEVEVPGLMAQAGSAAETLALKLTRSNRTIAVSYATEAGHFQQAGIPTVVCGPGSIDQAHQPDEYIEEGEIAACIGFMRRLAGELGG